MRWLKKLFGKGANAAPREVGAEAGAIAVADAGDPLAAARWLAPHDNPYGLLVLDCRVSAATLQVANTDPGAAQRFAASRSADGRSFDGRSPDDTLSLECRFDYPGGHASKDGPLVRADRPEVKWDIHLWNGWLSFVRSTSQQLVYRASIRFEAGRAIVETVEAPGDAAAEDPEFCLREVDFLIKSHLFGVPAPHALPGSLRGTDRDVAEFSFSRHGAKGLFATYEDPTLLTTEALLKLPR